MGLVRFLLALSVVIAHLDKIPFGYRLIPGDLAVQCFFIISGFYMSLVLGRKYLLNRQGIQRFYLNRFLKLMPTYWIVLAITLACIIVTGQTFYFGYDYYLRWLDLATLPTKIWIVFTNFFVVGQDINMFRAADGSGDTFWTIHMTTENLPLSRFALVSPAWTVAMEIWFYLLAPFLAGCRWRNLFLIGAGSVGVRLILATFGYSSDPWSYRFFPSELALFIFGMLLNRFYFRYRTSISSTVGLFVTMILVGGILTYQYFGGEFYEMSNRNHHLGFLIFFALCIPAVFAWSRDLKWDRLLGEISYPLYLCHWAIIIVMKYLSRSLDQYDSIIIMGLSVVVGWTIFLLVEKPIDRIRQKGLLDN
jgi:peptidoglycan/LPS O-acetylase OafA/YrhL